MITPVLRIAHRMLATVFPDVLGTGDWTPKRILEMLVHVMPAEITATRERCVAKQAPIATLSLNFRGIFRC
jgi:hypothetical protein